MFLVIYVKTVCDNINEIIINKSRFVCLTYNVSSVNEVNKKLEEAKNKFKLEGRSFLSKLFCGIFNWLGHLISDVSGSYGSVCKGNRGMGIPSPLWTWINDIIVSFSFISSKYDA